MIFNNETHLQWSDRQSKWRKKFAWLPVLCVEENKWRWLEFVWTRFYYRSGQGNFHEPFVYHYGYRGLLSTKVSAITPDHEEYMDLVAKESLTALRRAVEEK